MAKKRTRKAKETAGEFIIIHSNTVLEAEGGGPEIFLSLEKAKKAAYQCCEELETEMIVYKVQQVGSYLPPDQPEALWQDA